MQKIANVFAPGGVVRASINLGNPILAHRVDGVAGGVSVDLAQKLARELGLALELVVVDSARESVENVERGKTDFGFFAIDPKRAEKIAFSAPYLLIEGAYLVMESSPLQAIQDVDMPFHRITVGAGSAYDLFLTRSLKSARIERVAESPKVVEAMRLSGVEVAAGVKQQLEADAARFGDMRLLPDRFMVIEQAMGVHRSRGEAAAKWLTAFVERMKAEGFIQEALARHQIEGATVAPAIGIE